jgi:hypothetical protein
MILFLLVLLAILYYLPALIAIRQKHPMKFEIFLLNFALGWTVIVWVIAFLAAMSTDSRREPGEESRAKQAVARSQEVYPRVSSKSGF